MKRFNFLKALEVVDANKLETVKFGPMEMRCDIDQSPEDSFRNRKVYHFKLRYNACHAAENDAELYDVKRNLDQYIARQFYGEIHDELYKLSEMVIEGATEREILEWVGQLQKDLR